jgi:peptide/nickel transport system substrate-binding protein
MKLSSRAGAFGRVGMVVAGVFGAGGLFLSTATAGAATPPGVHTVTTTPAGTGKVSSIVWDLPSGEPTTLDYVKSATYSPDLVVENMCTDLLRLTPTFGIKPALATSWYYTNSTTLVFHIRKGVHFWNGQELTATDVAYSMLRNLNPKDEPVNGEYYEYVKSITVTGPYQVTVHFSTPDELFIKEMATISGAVAEKSYMVKVGKTFGTPKGGVMCTGPYELSKWTAGNDIVLKANPHFWTSAYKPKISTITVKWVTSTSTLTSGLLSGEIDGVYGAPATSYSELETASDGKLYFGKSLIITEIAPTSNTGPIGNLKVREALSLALDRTAIAKVIYGGAAVPNEALTPPTAWTGATSTYEAAYKKLPSDKVDISEAKKLVSSVPDHTKPIVLAVLAGDETELELGTAVQQAGAEIGLDVKLDEMPSLDFDNAFFTAGYRKGINMIVDNGYLDVPTPLDYLGLWFPKGALFDYTTYTNPTVNVDLKKAIQNYTDKARAGLIGAAQALYMKDLIVIPVVNPDEGLFLNNSITGAPASFAYIYEPCFAKLGAPK